MIYIILAVISLVVSILFEDRKGETTIRAVICDFFHIFGGVMLFLGLEYYITKNKPIILNKKDVDIKIDTVIKNNDTTYFYKICKKTQEN